MSGVRMAEWPSRLPYGVYTCADGREVLFDRDYIPLVQRRGTVLEAANEDVWVHHVRIGWFRDDGTAHRRRLVIGASVLHAFFLGRSLKPFVINEQRVKQREGHRPRPRRRHRGAAAHSLERV